MRGVQYTPCLRPRTDRTEQTRAGEGPSFPIYRSTSALIFVVPAQSTEYLSEMNKHARSHARRMPCTCPLRHLRHQTPATRSIPRPHDLMSMSKAKAKAKGTSFHTSTRPSLSGTAHRTWGDLLRYSLAHCFQSTTASTLILGWGARTLSPRSSRGRRVVYKLGRIRSNLKDQSSKLCLLSYSLFLIIVTAREG